jgi:hypothetical protein
MDELVGGSVRRRAALAGIGVAGVLGLAGIATAVVSGLTGVAGAYPPPASTSTTLALGGDPGCPEWGCGMNHSQVLV